MLQKRLQERIDRKKAALDSLRPLPAAAVQRLQEEMLVEWIYHSNAIEGNTLTLQETRLILETGLTIGGKSLREHFEVTNHRSAIHFVQALVENRQPLTPLLVRQIHQLVLAQIDDENAGQYRRLPVRIAGSTHTPPDARKIERLMLEWGDWVDGESYSLHLVERAALAHHGLVKIHPFIDGNGRTARLAMNLLSMQNGYPPTIIQQNSRGQYYRVLAHADSQNPAPLVNFVGRAVERSLTLYIEACTPRISPRSAENEWISLAKAAEGTPYSQEYLSLLARTGRLEAVKRGRNWVTTRQAVEAYRVSVG